MDAVLQLFINRDHQLCEAYAQVNEKKPGYVPRSESFFIKSNLSTILMCEQSIESMLADPSVLLCIQKQFFMKAYRCIIPLLWEIKNEWLLIIIDPSTNSVHTIYPKYTTEVVQSSSGDERVANSIVLRDKLSAILSTSPSRTVNLPKEVVLMTSRNHCEQLLNRISYLGNFTLIIIPLVLKILSKIILIIVHLLVWIVEFAVTMTVVFIFFMQWSATIMIVQYSTQLQRTGI